MEQKKNQKFDILVLVQNLNGFVTPLRLKNSVSNDLDMNESRRCWLGTLHSLKILYAWAELRFYLDD